MLDIQNPPVELSEHADFVTCSDVLEHVLPPLDKSLLGLHGILKHGGELIASVPIVRETGETIEHYPGLQSYRVEQAHQGHRVWGTFEYGVRLIDQPIFHGGPGNTLELRRFTKEGFRNALSKAGFVIVEEGSEDAEFGVPRGVGPIFRAKKP